MAIEVCRHVWDLPLPGARKLVLLCLADHADNQTWNAWPSVARVSEKTGLTRRAVQQHLAGLVSDGHLAIVRPSVGGRGQSTLYVVLPRLAELSTGYQQNRARNAPFRGPQEAGHEENRARGAQYGAETAHLATENRAPGAPQPSVNHEPPRAHARERHAELAPLAGILASPSTGNSALDAAIRGAKAAGDAAGRTQPPPEPGTPRTS